MTCFNIVRHAFIILIFSALAAPAVAQDRLVERFAGTVRIGSQPGLPIHLELLRTGDAVEGTISIPGARFSIVDARGRDTIAGRFEGEGGSGALSLRVAGDSLSGTFDFQGQSGSLTAERTMQSAEAFFRPPAEKLDLTSTQWRQDLDRLSEILTSEHAAPFHRIKREQLDADVAKLRAAIPDLDGIRIALEFRKLGALIGDGHTAVALPDAMARLPVEFYWFDDGLRVVAISADHAALLGSRLVAINDMPAAEVTERMRAVVPQGETVTYHRANVAALLNSPDSLRAVGIVGGQPITFTIETRDGSPRQLEIEIAGQDAALSVLGGSAPLWQQNTPEGFWSKSLEDGTVYVNWRSYDDLAKHSTVLLQQLDATQPRRLVIDLRDNAGGDFNLGRAFIAEIGKRPWLDRQGALYVLIGRKTFSAAMTNATDFKQRTKAILVGEPAGAAPNNWQEVRRFHLPNSGLHVGVSTRFYEFLPGETELRPDHEVPPGPEDWGRPVDSAVKFILAQPVP